MFFESGLPKNFGSITSKESQVLLLGLTIVILLRFAGKGISYFSKIISGGAFLFSIIISSLYCNSVGIMPDAVPELSMNMLDGIGKIDYFPFVTPSFFTVFLVLFLIDFYGSIGKFIGLTSRTNLYSKNKGLVGIENAMYVDGIGTVGGALLGTTSIITYVESAIGIQAGGRTGLVSLVCGVLIILSLIFTPLISLVPVVATSGVLLYVGYSLLPIEEFRKGELTYFDILVGIIMGIISFITFSLDRAMLFGFLAYTLRQVVLKEEKVNIYLLISTILLGMSVCSQYLFKA